MKNVLQRDFFSCGRRRVLFATGIAMAAFCSGALSQAEVLKPLPEHGGTFAIGVVQGVGYYTVQEDGYHIILTLTKGIEKPVRFEAVLADNQSVVLTSPKEAAERSESIVVQCKGEEIVVTKDVDARPMEEVKP